MTGPSLTKDFHRLMKRIGRLTDGQASIDDVDWEGGNLNSFKVVIRPNASYYKNGRFKFTVNVPESFVSGDPPTVWCETDIYHPNIDRSETRMDGVSNVCLNMFESGTWKQSYGLEGVVLGLLFLMHNPNIEDPLSPEFDSDNTDCEVYAQNVNDFMAGKDVDGENYVLDFRVVDGVFEDLTIIDDKAKQIAVAADNITVAETSPANGDGEATTASHTEELPIALKTGDTDSNINAQSELSTSSKCIKHTESGEQDADVERNNKLNISDEEDEEDIMPVRFVSDEIDGCGYFVMQFGDYDDEPATDNSAGGVNSNPDDCDTKEDITTPLLEIKTDMSKSVTNLTEIGQNRVLSRSVSVPNDFYVKPFNKHKQVDREGDLKLLDLARLALDCIFTVYKNIL